MKTTTNNGTTVNPATSYSELKTENDIQEYTNSIIDFYSKEDYEVDEENTKLFIEMVAGSNFNGAFEVLEVIDSGLDLDICALIESETDLEVLIGVITDLQNKLDMESDSLLEYEDAEYRIISEDVIWDIYVEEIEDLIKDCYLSGCTEIPSFLAIDWEETAKNCYVDGYGHHFSSYDGSEENEAGFYIFRIN